MSRKYLSFVILLTLLAKSFSVRSSSQLRVLDEDGKSSLAFVFDTTGSMHNDLRQLREGAEMILDTALEDSNVIADFIFVPFHDPTVGPATVTKEKKAFKSALNIVRVYGGGDCPEKSLGGIQLALNVSRPRSYVYVFTDATASDHAKIGDVLDAVQRKQSQVVFVLTGHCNDLHRPHYKVYQQIAAASSGQVFNLNKTSVHKVLDFVRSSIKGRTVNLGSAVNKAGYNYTQGIPVDNTLAEVTVSVSGSKPSISVVKPSGEAITGPPQLVTTLDLNEIMVVKVLQPEPGNWSITTGSENDHSVRVIGLSNLTFNHGFSVEPPKDMSETSYRPLQGTYNHMMISLTKTDLPVEITYAEIKSLDGKVLFEVSLREVDSRRKVYLADPFVPPDELFYIAINGHDEYKQELRRVGATAVQSKAPDAPYLTVPQQIKARVHETVVLRCEIESLVPLTAMWTKDNVKIQPQISSLQSTSIEYVISYVKEESAGIYKCVAKNVAGASTATTEIRLIVDPPQVTISPKNGTLLHGDNLTITCTALSDALLFEYRLIFNGTLNHYANDYSVNRNQEGLYVVDKTIENASERDSGQYSCVVSNRGGQTRVTSHITVQTDPIAQILGPHTLTKPIHSDTQLVCHVEYADAIVWIRPNGSVEKQENAHGSLTDMYDVRNITEDGIWTCLAVKGKLNASDSVEISVVTKPAVTIEGVKNITVVNGTNMEIVCTVVAKPPPRILWHRETESFLNNTVTATSPNVYKSVLTLNSSKEDVKGTYFCFGENSEGIHQDSVTVGVRRKLALVGGFTDQTVELYSQISLPCQIDSHPPANITWYHNDTEIEENDNIYLSEDRSALYILKVDFGNLGQYSCVADNGFEKMAIDGALKVVGLEYPRLSKEPVRRITQKGRSTILTCRVLKGTPQPVLSWRYKSNVSSTFTTLPRGVISNIANSELIISTVELHHRGLYRCLAENVLGNDTYNVLLVVQFPPELAQDPNATNETHGSLLDVKAGDRVNLSCKARGVPPPMVTWSKDGQSVRYSNNIYLTDASELVIANATVYDTGVYTCDVASSLGSTQKNFSLVVYVPPSITTTNMSLDREVLEGDLVELPCGHEGTPTPRVEWSHNGQIVTGGRKYIDEFGLRFVANLTDFGEYVCTARNQYGNTSIKYFLYVWVVPYIKPPLETTIDMLLGNNASLQCDAVAFPIPIIFWEFRDRLLTENSTQLSFNDYGNMNVTNATIDHDGVYVCIAQNVAGVAKKAIHLNVNEAPQIIPDNYTGPYVASVDDNELLLSCEATGKPRPYVVWQKDGRYLDRGTLEEGWSAGFDTDIDGTLTIKELSEELSGEYTCIAKNIVGTANKTVSVEIYSLPNRMQADESKSSMTLLEDTNSTIECPLSATSPDKVKWYKDAKLVSTGYLHLRNVSRDNASTYACVVKESIGSSVCFIQVIVEWAPRFVSGELIREKKKEYEMAETKSLVDNDKQKLIAKTKQLKDDLEIEISKGDDYFFHCDVDANPEAKITWLFKSKPLLGEERNILKLINIQSHQAGVYRCTVHNKHGTVIKQFQLDVLEPPFISEFDLLDVQLKEGASVTLDCNARGTPKPLIKWTYNNSNWRLQNDSLKAYNITPQSEGIYRCEAVNKAGAALLVYRVKVTVPAAVKGVTFFTQGASGGVTVERSVEVSLGSRIRLSCTASGKPFPTIQWIHNGNIISENDQDIPYADLVLDKVGTGDGGAYSCVATNEGGATEKGIKIDVLEPPTIFKNIFESAISNKSDIRLEVLSGQPFYMHCHVYGNPSPDVYWFKDNLPLRLFDDAMVSQQYGEVLVSKAARSEHTGNYTCEARNKVGYDSLVYLVQVLVPPPTPKETGQRVKARFGSSLALPCPVQGSPLPNVVWIKHPYTEVGGQTPRVTLANDGFTLIINNTEVQDSGKYSCILTNKAGTTELIFDVTIEKAPTIAENVGDGLEETRVVALKRSIVLKCQADGNPPPEIRWLKDTQPLSDNLSNIQTAAGNSLLAAWAVTPSLGGQYICIAANDVGSAHRRYRVIVQVPGKWSSWSQWSLCNATCGLGYQLRARICHYTDDYNVTYDKTTKSDKVILDESSCKGAARDRRKCHMPPCEDEDSQSRWSVWSKWSECSAKCGAGGTQARSRRCRGGGGGGNCKGDNVQIRKCPNLPPCDPTAIQPAPPTANDVFTSNEDTHETSAYIPEATFEMKPEAINPAEVEEFYIKSEAQPSDVFYEVNVTRNLDDSYRGSCPLGYTQNNLTLACDDIDECDLPHNACHWTQVCANTAGAYRCGCPKGFLALGAGQRCLDVNECALGVARCEFACVNTAGGYVCACPNHLRLHEDRHHCVTPSSYRKPFSHEELNTEEYLSASIDFPARYLKNKN